MDRLFDEIVLQVYPSNLDDAQTAGRLITGRDVNETYLHHNGISDSEFESSSHKQDEYLTKIFDEILWQVLSKDSKYSSKEDARTTAEPLTWEDANETHSAENKEPSLFNRDVSPQLTAEDNETLQKSTRGASRESLPCGQLLSFLQKNIISATVAMAAVLLVTVLVVFTLVTYKRRRQTNFRRIQCPLLASQGTACIRYMLAKHPYMQVNVSSSEHDIQYFYNEWEVFVAKFPR
ncbi:uncharacterized protein C2orf92 homolog isoform X6 [Mus musculus]|nr:uncharacterized protein C2orf92 homolog isoform X6 [Mus musculus]